MSARPGAQDAETVLGVVVGYSLDESYQHLPGIRLRTHADHRVSRFIPGVLLLIRGRCREKVFCCACGLKFKVPVAI